MKQEVAHVFIAMSAQTFDDLESYMQNAISDVIWEREERGFIPVLPLPQPTLVLYKDDIGSSVLLTFIKE